MDDNPYQAPREPSQPPPKRHDLSVGAGFALLAGLLVLSCVIGLGAICFVG